jgi:hypothetical protein
MTQNNVGIYASQISGHLSVPAFQGDFWALNNVVLSSSASSITLTGIPSGYTHLQLRMLLRSTTTNGDVGLFINGTAFSARRHTISGDGSATSGGTDTANSIARQTQSTDTASVFAVSIIDILDYGNITKYKTIREIGGFDANGSGSVNVQSHLIQDKSSIKSITIAPYNSSGSFATYSQIALYGIK